MVGKIDNWTLVPLEFKQHCQDLSIVFIVQIATLYMNIPYTVPNKWSINWFSNISRD